MNPSLSKSLIPYETCPKISAILHYPEPRSHRVAFPPLRASLHEEAGQFSSGPPDLHFGGQSICHATTDMTLFMKVVPDRYYGTRAIRSHFVAGMRICWRGKGQGGNLGLCRSTHSAASKAVPSARWTTRSERRNIIALLPLWKKSWPRLCPPTEAGPFSVASVASAAAAKSLIRGRHHRQPRLESAHSGHLFSNCHCLV